MQKWLNDQWEQIRGNAKWEILKRFFILCFGGIVAALKTWLLHQPTALWGMLCILAIAIISPFVITSINPKTKPGQLFAWAILVLIVGAIVYVPTILSYTPRTVTTNKSPVPPARPTGDAPAEPPKVDAPKDEPTVGASRSRAMPKKSPAKTKVALKPPETPATDASASTGTVNVGPCGVFQNGGSGNQATGGNCTINPAPTSPPVLSQTQVQALRSWSESHRDHPINIFAPFQPAPVSVTAFGRQLQDGLRATGGIYSSVNVHGGCYTVDYLTPWISFAAGKNSLGDAESLANVIINSGIQGRPIMNCPTTDDNEFVIILVRP